jgi:predicted thioesterase
MTELAVGLSGVHSAVVRETDTAIALGSGSVPVLATPRLVAWLEAAAVAAVDGTIRDGSTTVGTLIDLQHHAATAVGRPVVARATVTSFDGRTIEFELSATDDRATIATGRHTRVIVDVERFVGRL